MKATYTASETRTQFSEVMRRVRDGDTIVVTYRGEPVAEIGPLEKRAQTLEERTRWLGRRGVSHSAKDPNARPKLGKCVPGAMERLLA